MPCASAVFGLMYATLSHVTFESGLGNSCSQALLAKRPSSTCGSGRKMISSPVFAAGAGAAGCAGAAVAAAPPRIEVPCEETVVQSVAPERIRRWRTPDRSVPQRAVTELSRPVLLHQIHRRLAGRAVQRGQHFNGGAAVVDRRDQRLNQGDRAVEAAHVAPRFQVVRFRQMPVALFGGFVDVESQMRSGWRPCRGPRRT